MKTLYFIAPFEYITVEKNLQVLGDVFSQSTSKFHSFKLDRLHVAFKCFEVVHP